MINTKLLQSPCVPCKHINKVRCRAKCHRLNEFVIYMDHTDSITFGVADTTDSYKLTSK